MAILLDVYYVPGFLQSILWPWFLQKILRNGQCTYFTDKETEFLRLSGLIKVTEIQTLVCATPTVLFCLDFFLHL